MCSRYYIDENGHKVRIEDDGEFFGDVARPSFKAPTDELRPRIFAPTNAIPILRLDEGKLEIILARWSYVPAWYHGPKLSTFNATVEKASQPKGYFAGGSPVLVLASGIFEWPVKGKPPVAIRLKDQPLMAMAGLLTHDADGVPNATIVTTPPGEWFRRIHHRQAAFLRPEDRLAWLDKTMPKAARLALLEPYPDDQMVAEPVAGGVESVLGVDSDMQIGPALGVTLRR